MSHSRGEDVSRCFTFMLYNKTDLFLRVQHCLALFSQPAAVAPVDVSMCGSCVVWCFMSSTTCPPGEEWAAATTEGSLIYSLSQHVVFDPIDLEPDITPSQVRTLLVRGEYAESLLLALRLNEENVIQEVLETTPKDHSKRSSVHLLTILNCTYYVVHITPVGGFCCFDHCFPAVIG